MALPWQWSCNHPPLFLSKDIQAFRSSRAQCTPISQNELNLFGRSAHLGCPSKQVFLKIYLQLNDTQFLNFTENSLVSIQFHTTSGTNSRPFICLHSPHDLTLCLLHFSWSFYILHHLKQICGKIAICPPTHLCNTILYFPHRIVGVI